MKRSNVIFEIGFFKGRLGLEHTVLVSSRDTSPALPRDFANGAPATCAKREDAYLAAALGPAVTRVKAAMRRAAA